MITERQNEILNILIKEYIGTAKPVSSELLEKKANLDFCPATIRNEMKKLTEMGYLAQPHTSAGRIPTSKGYKYFVERNCFEDEQILPDFIALQINKAHEQIEEEMAEMNKLMDALKSDNLFEILIILDEWHKKI